MLAYISLKHCVKQQLHKLAICMGAAVKGNWPISKCIHKFYMHMHTIGMPAANVDFTSLASFRRSILKIDLSNFIKRF